MPAPRTTCFGPLFGSATVFRSAGISDNVNLEFNAISRKTRWPGPQWDSRRLENWKRYRLWNWIVSRATEEECDGGDHGGMLVGAQKPYEEGSIRMDTPEHNTTVELAELTQNRKSWQVIKHAIQLLVQISSGRSPHSHKRTACSRAARLGAQAA